MENKRSPFWVSNSSSVESIVCAVRYEFLEFIFILGGYVMTWDIENFLEYLSGTKEAETNDNLVSSLVILRIAQEPLRFFVL